MWRGSRTTGSGPRRRPRAGCRTATTGSTCRRTYRSRAGLPNISLTGFFSVGDAQQPFVSRLNEVSQFTDDVTWVFGRHSTKFGARRAPGTHGHQLREPSKWGLHVHGIDHRAVGERTCRFPARAAGAVQARDAEHRAGWHGLALLRLRAGRVPADPAGDDQRGSAIRASDPFRRRERRAQLVPSWPAVNPLSQCAARSRLSRRCRCARRHLRH